MHQIELLIGIAILALNLATNLATIALNLKLYTEIMKDSNMTSRTRRKDG